MTHPPPDASSGRHDLPHELGDGPDDPGVVAGGAVDVVQEAVGGRELDGVLHDVPVQADLGLGQALPKPGGVDDGPAAGQFDVAGEHVAGVGGELVEVRPAADVDAAGEGRVDEGAPDVLVFGVGRDAEPPQPAAHFDAVRPVQVGVRGTGADAVGRERVAVVVVPPAVHGGTQ